MIKILHVVSSLGGGGVESMLYNYYLHMDRSKIRFDFIAHGSSVGSLEDKLSNLGASIFHVTPKKTSFKRNVIEINKIIRNGDYDVIHCHQNFSNFVPLLLAKWHRVPIRISHSHGCIRNNSFKIKIKNGFLKFLNRIGANYFFACGMEAGKWLNGKCWKPNDKNIIMENAIDTNKFSYNQQVRDEYRKKLNVDKNIVLLHVGRFSDEKNHLFMIEIMKCLSKQNGKHILMFAGDGSKEEMIKTQVSEEGLENKIIFLGLRDDISALMNAADIFILPSKNEGFPVTLVEAQVTGLIALASDRVSPETALTDLIRYITIENANVWSDVILSLDLAKSRTSRAKEIKDAGFDIESKALKYSEWIMQTCNSMKGN